MTYMYIHAHRYVRIYIVHVYYKTVLCTYTYMHMYIRMYVCMFVCMYVCTVGPRLSEHLCATSMLKVFR